MTKTISKWLILCLTKRPHFLHISGRCWPVTPLFGFCLALIVSGALLLFSTHDQHSVRLYTCFSPPQARKVISLSPSASHIQQILSYASSISITPRSAHPKSISPKRTFSASTRYSRDDGLPPRRWLEVVCDLISENLRLLSGEEYSDQENSGGVVSEEMCWGY